MKSNVVLERRTGIGWLPGAGMIIGEFPSYQYRIICCVRGIGETQRVDGRGCRRVADRTIIAIGGIVTVAVGVALAILGSPLFLALHSYAARGFFRHSRHDKSHLHGLREIAER